MKARAKSLGKKLHITRLEDCDSRLYYGVSIGINPDARRGFIMRQKYAVNAPYQVICLSNLTICNSWTNLDASNVLTDFIKQIMVHWQVYQFETAKDLFNWVCADDSKYI